jgi:hypothetical protein
MGLWENVGKSIARFSLHSNYSLPREKPRDLWRFYFRFRNDMMKQKCYIGRYILERGQFKALNMMVIPVTEGSQPTHFFVTGFSMAFLFNVTGFVEKKSL